jgi:hypothetical protein
MAKHTNPTGFSSDPPLGPAIPVIAIPISLISRWRAPCAISRAVSMLTAP